MLFRPDFFLDQVSEKYTTVEGPAAIETLTALEADKDIRLTIEGPDFDTGDVRPVTISVPAKPGDVLGALSDQGLATLVEEDKLLLEEPFPGTPHFEALGNEYDFYGDSPVIITQMQVENDRFPKELFFIPALLLLAGVVMLQRPRATQPAF
ncbi:MAG: DUF3394 domain-containing protein [Pseudomonadota bacterium]